MKSALEFSFLLFSSTSDLLRALLLELLTSEYSYMHILCFGL